MFFNTKDKNAIETGCMYRKMSGINSVWVVDKMLEYPDLPPHVRLIEKGGNERTITIALCALLDERLWRPVDAP